MENVSNLRAYRGQQINETLPIRLHKGYFLVPSQSGKRTPYKVHSTHFTCNCPDYTFRQIKCKHIHAVEFLRSKENAPVIPFVPRNKYAQDWTAYNKSQTSEKHVFLGLLSELTRGIDEPENETGRPALNLGDMLFSCVFKVYSQMSARRFTTDLIDAKVKGYINEAPHYNSLCRYMEKTSITEYLERLVEETAKPLASLETDFAVDSTGLGTSNSISWFRAKHKDTVMVERKTWVKLHCAIGTKTNVITGVEITGKDSHDSNHFIPVMEATRKNFDVREVSADKAYNSLKHFSYAEIHGIEPFLAFRDDADRYSNKSASAVWQKAYHYFNLNRTEFLQHYGKRSNAETTFHMLKSKFGSMLKSKTFEAQKNEALCKVICHNISCLIHSMNELGISPEFLIDSQREKF